MKKLNIIFLLSFLAFFACSKEDIVDSQTKTYTIYATAPNGDETKTNLDGITVNWSAGDQIAVFGKNDYHTKYVYTISGGVGSSSATFTSDSGCDEEEIFALYPASRAGFYIEGMTTMDAGKYSSQQYVQNGIESNLMAMAAVGTPSSLNFSPVDCILRLNLKTSTPKKISYIQVSTSSYLAFKQYWQKSQWRVADNQFYSHDRKISIVYTVNADLGLTPVQYNIVVKPGTLTDLTFKIFATDGSVATLSKSTGLSTVSGKVYNFPETDISFISQNVQIEYDGSGEWIDWPTSGVLDTPASSIAVKTSPASSISENHLSAITTAISTATTPIDIDLSKSAYAVTIWPKVFYNSTKVKTLKLPYNIESTENYSFQFSQIEKVYIGKAVTEIGAMSGSNCRNLKYVVDEENTAYSSDECGALYDKIKQKLVEAPGGVTGDAYTVASSVTTFATYAFTNNPLLKELTIPENVSSIGVTALSGCSYLDIITVLATTPPTIGASFSMKNVGTKAVNRKVNVPAGTKSSYETAWAKFLTHSYPYTFVEPDSFGATASLSDLAEE